MYHISDNDDMFNIGQLNSLIQSIPDGKQFHFSRSDVYSVVDGFDNRGTISMYMSNKCGDLIFNTCIGYDNSYFGIR